MTDDLGKLSFKMSVQKLALIGDQQTETGTFAPDNESPLDFEEIKITEEFDI